MPFRTILSHINNFAIKLESNRRTELWRKEPLEGSAVAVVVVVVFVVVVVVV